MGVPKSIYVIFIIIQCYSILFAALMLPPKCIVRSDGSQLADFRPIALRQSICRLSSLFTDGHIAIMLPAFFAAEIFVVLQSSLNAYSYNLCTRKLEYRIDKHCPD